MEILQTCLKKLNQQVLADGLYHEKELQQAGDNPWWSFITAGDTFLGNLIENLKERFPKETLDICKALDLVVNPQSPPESAAAIAAHGADALNKPIEHYGQPNTTSGDRDIDPLIDPDVTRADYLQFKFILNTYHLMNRQQFIKRFLADEGLCEQFPTFATLANIALIIPVSSASCERGFLVKTESRQALETDYQSKT